MILALTDSYAVFQLIRALESFLDTREAFQDVQDHLKPGGVFVL